MKEKSVDFTINNFEPGEEIEIAALIRDVYDAYVAPDYSQNGNDFFYQFIQPEEILERASKNIDLILIAKYEDKIIGVLSIKLPNHISLLFVNKAFQGQGVSKALFNKYLKTIINTDVNEITVHSSPFSEKIYEKLGFYKESEMKETFGIKYIPMKMKINK